MFNPLMHVTRKKKEKKIATEYNVEILQFVSDTVGHQLVAQ